MIDDCQARRTPRTSSHRMRVVPGLCDGTPLRLRRCRSPLLEAQFVVEARCSLVPTGGRPAGPDRIAYTWVFLRRATTPGSGPSRVGPIDVGAYRQIFPLSKTLLSGTARRGTARRGTSSPGLDSRPRLCTGTVGRLGRTRALLSHLKTETVARLCTSDTVGRLGRARALLSHPSNRVVGVAARVARVVPQLAAALAERRAVTNEVARQVHVRCRWCVRVRRPPRPQCLLHGGTADAVADKGLGR